MLAEGIAVLDIKPKELQNDNLNLVSVAWTKKAYTRLHKRMKYGETAEQIVGVKDKYYLDKIVAGLFQQLTYEICSRILEWEKEDAEL